VRLKMTADMHLVTSRVTTYFIAKFPRMQYSASTMSSDQARPRPRPRPQPAIAPIQPAPNRLPSPTAEGASSPIEQRLRDVEEEDSLFIRNKARTASAWKEIEKRSLILF
jgi:hypothetical protein